LYHDAQVIAFEKAKLASIGRTAFSLGFNQLTYEIAIVP
jgi:hypothetical protein